MNANNIVLFFSVLRRLISIVNLFRLYFRVLESQCILYLCRANREWWRENVTSKVSTDTKKGGRRRRRQNDNNMLSRTMWNKIYTFGKINPIFFIWHAMRITNKNVNILQIEAPHITLCVVGLIQLYVSFSCFPLFSAGSSFPCFFFPRYSYFLYMYVCIHGSCTATLWELNWKYVSWSWIWLFYVCEWVRVRSRVSVGCFMHIYSLKFEWM